MKKVTILLLMLFISSCAPKISYLTQTGQQVPFPSYSLSSTGLNIYTTFYYTLNTGLKDLDGTIISAPKYLNLFTTQDMFLGTKQTLTLTIEVFNPEEVEYGLYEKASYSDVKDNKTEKFGKLGYSKLSYRKFVFNLPVTQQIKSMNYSVILHDKKGNMIFICGPFKYNVIM